MPTTAPPVIERIRGEYLEMPGLKLTLAQACRLWRLNNAVCEEALTSLVDAGFLHRTPSGAFIALPAVIRMLKASIPASATQWQCPHCLHLNVVQLDTQSGSTMDRDLRCAACSRLVSTVRASA